VPADIGAILAADTVNATTVIDIRGVRAALLLFLFYGGLSAHYRDLLPSSSHSISEHDHCH